MPVYQVGDAKCVLNLRIGLETLKRNAFDHVDKSF